MPLFFKKFGVQTFLTLLSGALSAIAYPPFNQPYLIFFSLIPLFFLLDLTFPTSAKKHLFWHGFRLGYLFGVGFFLVNFKWLTTVAWFGWLSIAFYLALYPAIFGGITIFWIKKIKLSGHFLPRFSKNLALMLFISAVWVTTEWLRSWMLTGMGWNGLAVPLIEMPLLAQSAEFIGVYGLSFLPAFINVGLYITLRCIINEAKLGKIRAHPEFSIAMALLITTFALGLLRTNELKARDFTSLNTLAVQGNFSLEEFWDTNNGHQILSRYEKLIHDAYDNYQETFDQKVKELITTQTSTKITTFFSPELIIFPEDSVPFYHYQLGDETFFGNNGDGWMSHVSERHQAPLLLGISRLALEDTPQGLKHAPHKGLWNDLLLYSAQDETDISYRSKKHLVPFGEYIPLRKQLPFLEWIFKQSAGFAMNGDVLPGESSNPILLKIKEKTIQLTPLICFEDTTPHISRSYKKNHPNFLVNVTNDGWFLQSEAAEQHYQNSRFRAIEQRSPLIRAGNTGRSAIVNIFGVEAIRNTNQQNKLIDAKFNVKPHESGTYSGIANTLKEPINTLYYQWGDWFCLLCSICVTLGIFYQKYRHIFNLSKAPQFHQIKKLK